MNLPYEVFVGLRYLRAKRRNRTISFNTLISIIGVTIGVAALIATLGIMTISANYEGPYPNLTKFINELDRSPRFMIIEGLQASPQPVGTTVNVNFKLNAFVKDDTGGLQ